MAKHASDLPMATLLDYRSERFAAELGFWTAHSAVIILKPSPTEGLLPDGRCAPLLESAHRALISKHTWAT
jgi:hypothetical protein